MGKAKNSESTPLELRNLNTSGVSFKGCICRIDSSGNPVAAFADSAANARAVGVYQGRKYRISPLGSGAMQVFLSAGLNSGTAPAKGQPVYLSDDEEGEATNVAPTIKVQIGIIQDLGSGYDNTNGSLATIVSAGALGPQA